MSQTIQSPSVVSLAKGLNATSGFDPDETMQVPIAAFVAADGPVAPEAKDAIDPSRAKNIRAAEASLKLWLSGPTPDYVQVHKALAYGGANVEAYLHQDAGLARMQEFVEFYDGVLSHEEYSRVDGVARVLSSYKFRLDGVLVTVWTINDGVQVQG